MTKKDFEYFANYVVQWDIRDRMVDELVMYFKSKNSRFNEKTFRDKITQLRHEREQLLTN